MDYTIWVTGECNMCCEYCYVDGVKNQKRLGLDSIPMMIDFIHSTYRKEKVKINFFGGEPLINFSFLRKFIDEIEKAKRIKAEYYMTTNGLLIDASAVDFFKENNIKISLSCDGNKFVNDMNRKDLSGNGTYDRIRQAYLFMVNHGVKDIRVRGTITPNNSRYLYETVEGLYELDNNINAILVPDYFDSKWTEDQIIELSKKVREINNNKKYQNIMIIGDRELIKAHCSGGKNSFHIYMDGNIYPCSFVVDKSQFKIGSLTNGLDGDVIEKLSCNYKVPLRGCRGCDYHDYCLSNKCRFLNWSLTGNLNEASALVCQFENIKMQ